MRGIFCVWSVSWGVRVLGCAAIPPVSAKSLSSGGRIVIKWNRVKPLLNRRGWYALRCNFATAFHYFGRGFIYLWRGFREVFWRWYDR